ncbi:hypothetical protein G6011_04725 [Alternaria panax]|uniref:C2H2-type domain-containing protein n=1 Tax=Alternaria panax TaxID=48097 RepID=A0AAD4IHP5_9PLEO|nr:hypothetical protein G6011_04725 [Alternaria panax]
MYTYADQPTPPFNSPYQQHASRTGSLLESSYPSPGRQESQLNYAHDLGLYEVQSLQNGLPPSPQSSESWGGHYSNGASAEPIADPHLSGAFDHPVSCSPVPWSSNQPSSPTSPPLYSQRAMPSAAYSPDRSGAAACPSLKMEASSWNPSLHIGYGAEVPVTMSGPSLSRQPPLTVAPDRLSSTMYPYETVYPSPVMPKYEPASPYNYENGTYEGAPPVASGSSPRTRAIQSTQTANAVSLVNRRRARNRRHTDPALAPFHCELCPGIGFARRYNLNQHLLTHNAYRKKAHVCLHPECGKQFVRKTDLARHDGSVHSNIRPYKCPKCDNTFPRKDTLTRHETDGCSNRNQVSPESARYGCSKL